MMLLWFLGCWLWIAGVKLNLSRDAISVAGIISITPLRVVTYSARGCKAITYILVAVIATEGVTSTRISRMN